MASSAKPAGSGGDERAGETAGAHGNMNDVTVFTVTVKAGDAIFKEQDESRDMFIICRGQVKLTRHYAGEERLVELLDAGDFFGEMSLLEEQPREVSAHATSDCELFRIDASTFDLLVQEAPEIPIRMLRKLSRRLREHQEHEMRAAAIAMAPFQPAPERAQAAVPAPAPAPPGDAAPPHHQAGSGFSGPAAEPGAAPLAARLVHAASGARFDIDPARAELVVGRSDRSTGYAPDLDITALDGERTVGRRHARIIHRDEAYFLRDEKARNGTFVNDKRLEPQAEVALASGDRLRFGLVETTFELAAPAAVRAAPGQPSPA
jgi:hypothetical protein